MTDYEAVNIAWPQPVPPITREEAARAARKLMRHFGKRRSRWLRRVWIARDPKRAGDLRRGWRRLVHDVSHRVFTLQYPNATDHGGLHARLELEMVRYVVDKGWLAGSLRPDSRPKPRAATADQKFARVQAAIKRWEAKRKRAETALKKLRRRARYYQRVAEAA